MSYQVKYTLDYTPETGVASIYRMIQAGICGPFGNVGQEGQTREQAEQAALSGGFATTGQWSEVCANGFQSIQLVTTN